MDTDSIYIDKKLVEKVEKNLIDNNGSLLSMKNDYGEGKVIYEANFVMKKVKRMKVIDVKTK